MAPPFIAVMGDVDEAAKRLYGLFKYLQDPETKLLFHDYDVGTGKFVRRLRWATGNGWALMGIARVAIEAKKQGKLELYHELTGMGNEVLEALLRYQQSDGRFLDIVDDSASFIDGTSAMMMSVYIYRGVIEGWLGGAMSALCTKAGSRFAGVDVGACCTRCPAAEFRRRLGRGAGILYHGCDLARRRCGKNLPQKRFCRLQTVFRAL